MTALEKALADSGKPAEFYARKLGEPGSTKKQLRNQVAILRRRLRHGSASDNYAQRVAILLKIEGTPLHNLLLLPRACWPEWATQGATEQPAKAIQRKPPVRAGIAARPNHPPRPRQDRITVLEAI